jgi:hypothetical protein
MREDGVIARPAKSGRVRRHEVEGVAVNASTRRTSCKRSDGRRGLPSVTGVVPVAAADVSYRAKLARDVRAVDFERSGGTQIPAFYAQTIM